MKRAANRLGGPLLLSPRLRIAFSLNTICGWMAGVLLAGQSLPVEQDLTMVLTIALLGGVVTALISGRSWRTKILILAITTPYVAVLGQLTGFYLHIRSSVFIPELLLPCALAVFLFICTANAFGLKCLARCPDANS